MDFNSHFYLQHCDTQMEYSSFSLYICRFQREGIEVLAAVVTFWVTTPYGL
jgi:hypothetical protein